MKTFYEWIITKSKEDSVIGDFAKDVIRDKTFPHHFITRKELFDHVQSFERGSINDVLAEAWRKYRNHVNRADKKRYTREDCLTDPPR